MLYPVRDCHTLSSVGRAIAERAKGAGFNSSFWGVTLLVVLSSSLLLINAEIRSLIDFGQGTLIIFRYDASSVQDCQSNQTNVGYGYLYIEQTLCTSEGIERDLLGNKLHSPPSYKSVGFNC